MSATILNVGPIGGIYLSDHAKQRMTERHIPPYIVRKAIQAAMHSGDGEYVTSHGTIIVRSDAVTTVLSPGMATPGDLPKYTIR